MKKSNNHGGRRPGAGRPKGSKIPKTLEKEAAREAVRAFVTARMTPMLEAQLAAACGVKYIVARKKKGGTFRPVSKEMLRDLDPDEDIVEVWEKPPHTPAFVELMNRALDKATEHVEAQVNVFGEIQARLEAGRKRVAAAK
jgi:hypothetical protein